MCNQSPIMITSVSSKVFEDIAVKVVHEEWKSSKNKIKFVKIKKTYFSKNSQNKKYQLSKNCFSALVKTLIKLSIKETENKLAYNKDGAIFCPDQYVGIIKISKKATYWKSFRYPGKDYKKQSDDICNKCYKVLAIVLESPHKYEFDKDKAIGPAMGNTGANLLGWLPQLLYENKDIGEDTYKVVLVNAVQYQCSLGEDPNRYRNKIFSEMWGKTNVSQDFIKRLKSHKPKLVINCCTSKYKDKVEKEIKDNYSTELFRAKSHPSAWFKKENRNITKVK